MTPDEIEDVQKLDMWLDVNGERMQTGSTATMIFGVKTLVSYISQFMILEPGDVITTGTPPGVGHGQEAAAFSQGRRHGVARHRRARAAGAARRRVEPPRPERKEPALLDRSRLRGALCAGLRCALSRLPAKSGDLVRRPAARAGRPALHARHARAQRRVLRLRRRHDAQGHCRRALLLRAGLSRGTDRRGVPCAAIVRVACPR